MTGTCSQGPDTLGNVAESSTDLKRLRFSLIGFRATTDTGQTPRSEAELLLKLNRQARLQIVSLQSLPVWNARVDDDMVTAELAAHEAREAKGMSNVLDVDEHTTKEWEFVTEENPHAQDVQLPDDDCYISKYASKEL